MCLKKIKKTLFNPLIQRNEDFTPGLQQIAHERLLLSLDKEIGRIAQVSNLKRLDLSQFNHTAQRIQLIENTGELTEEYRMESFLLRLMLRMISILPT